MSDKKAATECFGLMNFRHQRASTLTSVLMEEIGDILPYETTKDVCNRIFHVLYQNGASVTTDEERARYGFEPRDDLGWTPSERVAEKRRELDAMQRLIYAMGDTK